MTALTKLEEFRRQKDAYFRSSAQSPIEDAGFEGLKYYPESPAFVFEAPIKRDSRDDVVELETSVGDIERYLRYGHVDFDVEGRPQRLTLFTPLHDKEPQSFFVPFRDASSGNETYGAGRYLEVEKTSAERVRLDFNYAYNPFCAYSPRWRCPMPPFENHLDVAIRAGEKNYH